MAPLQPPHVPAAPATLRSDHEHNLQAMVEGVQDRQDNLQTQIELMARNLSHMTQQFAAFQEFWMNQAAHNLVATPISAPSRAQFPSPSLRSCVADQLYPSSHQPSLPNLSTPALAFGSFPPPNPSQDFTYVSPTLPHTANNTRPTPQHVPQPFPYQLPPTPLNPPFPYRPLKIDLPPFMGDDVMGWLAMAEHFLRVNNVPPYERVQTIASLFDPDPSIWMNAFELRHPNPSWEDFSTALLCRFGAGSAPEFKGLLAHLQQTGTVEEFITDFTKLSCRAPDWAEHDLIPILIDGLRPELRHDVCALNPTSLADAQRLARCYETQNNAL